MIPVLASECTAPGRRGEPAAAAAAIVTPADLEREADRQVLGRFAPPGVIVDGNLNILHFRGHTRPFLKPTPSGDLRGCDAIYQRIKELQGELAAAREYLQAVIEDQDSAVEELKSSNQELMSANEELATLNEEQVESD